MSSAARTPTYRGFDYFYGYYNSYIDYWTKKYEGYIDLHNGLEPVLDAAALDGTLYAQSLFQGKAEKVIQTHATSYKTYPMFLLYSMQLVAAPYQVPSCPSHPSTPTVPALFLLRHAPDVPVCVLHNRCRRRTPRGVRRTATCWTTTSTAA